MALLVFLVVLFLLAGCAHLQPEEESTEVVAPYPKLITDEGIEYTFSPPVGVFKPRIKWEIKNNYVFVERTAVGESRIDFGFRFPRKNYSKIKMEINANASGDRSLTTIGFILSPSDSAAQTAWYWGSFIVYSISTNFYIELSKENMDIEAVGLEVAGPAVEEGLPLRIGKEFVDTLGITAYSRLPKAVIMAEAPNVTLSLKIRIAELD